MQYECSRFGTSGYIFKPFSLYGTGIQMVHMISFKKGLYLQEKLSTHMGTKDLYGLWGIEH